jgi:uncharacterized protein
MKILISGSTGLIGRHLVDRLKQKGHTIARLLRSKKGFPEQEILWDPSQNRLEIPAISGLDAVVHLAGEPIANGRWTASKKASIRDSRTQGTLLLSRALASAEKPPRVFVCASAIAYYGDRGDETLDEDAAPGHGFLSGVCQEWEAATLPASEAGIRVVNMRLGMVLSGEGGALPQIVKSFKLPVGGRLGTGAQYISWIALDDVLGAVEHIFLKESLSGAVNMVGPRAITNATFTETLARVLNRPAFLTIPAFAIRLLLGEMGRALLLTSTRATPRRLISSGYPYIYPDLEGALRHVLEGFS